MHNYTTPTIKAIFRDFWEIQAPFAVTPTDEYSQLMFKIPTSYDFTLVRYAGLDFSIGTVLYFLMPGHQNFQKCKDLSIL